jgi:hypothetical protein
VQQALPPTPTQYTKTTPVSKAQAPPTALLAGTAHCCSEDLTCCQSTAHCQTPPPPLQKKLNTGLRCQSMTPIITYVPNEAEVNSCTNQRVRRISNIFSHQTETLCVSIIHLVAGATVFGIVCDRCLLLLPQLNSRWGSDCMTKPQDCAIMYRGANIVWCAHFLRCTPLPAKHLKSAQTKKSSMQTQKLPHRCNTLMRRLLTRSPIPSPNFAYKVMQGG